MSKPTAFLLVSFIWGCTQPSRQPNNSSVSEIEQFLLEYYQTMSARNWISYKAFFWENAVISTIWQEQEESVASVHVFTIDEFIAQTGEGPDSQPVFEEKMTSHEISVRQNLAQAWVKYEAKFGTEDNLNQWEGTDLFTFMEYQGEWRIVSLAFSAD